jgi:hypothetical protein
MKTEKIKEFEKKLGVTFPATYVRFLKERSSAIIDGFKVMGISTEDVPMDVETATEDVLRQKRPDLPETLVAIIFVGSFATCLDLSRATEEDAPLVEVDLESNEPPIPVGNQTFSQWLEHHTRWEKRFDRAWKRCRNRQAEAKGRTRISDWSAPIFRVRDYIIAIGAFRFNYRLGCLEADEFLPIPQPHVQKDEPVKVLFSEAMARARDYCGSLNIQFTKDIREDENGVINPELEEKRIPAPIPPEILELAKKYSITLPQPEKGFIAHGDAVNLWFASFEFPKEVERRIKKLEEAGYLKREMIAEVVTLGHWTKEEVSWIFLNAPRPEALVMGSDSVTDRPSYAESLNYGRAALIPTRLKYAVIAAMNEGFTMEEIEEIKINCEIEPQKDFWLLRCNERFHFPEMWWPEFWSTDNVPEQRFEANEPILLLCRPHTPASKTLEMGKLQKYLEILINAKEEVQAKCLVLSNEYISPYYCKFLDEMKNFVKQARKKGIYVIFAPTRTDLYLDQEIQGRMYKVRSMVKLPSRQEAKKIQVFEVPNDCWKVSEGSKASRAIQNASQSALIFAQQLVRKREVRRYQMEFSLMCEVIEREASQNHKMIAEFEGEESLELLNALRHSEESLKNISFSFVTPEEMPQFLKKIRSKKLSSILKDVQGGIVVLVKPWEYPFIPPKKIESGLPKTTFVLPSALQKEIDNKIKAKESNKLYASHWDEIERAHVILRDSLARGLPFPIASMMGRVRSGVFTEMVRDYIYQMPGTSPVMMPISYGDGSQGGPFPLFTLPVIKQPNSDDFFVYNVGLVSLRHQEADKYLDRSLVKNREIQLKENAADQEELAFKKTYECIDELIKYIRGEITGKDRISPSLEILLGWKPELKQRRWQGLNLHVFHTTGLESAGIGTYRAITEILRRYRGEIMVTPRILIPNGDYKQGEKWF